MSDPKRYKAKYAFGVMLDGEQITVPAGEIVREGHPLLKGRDEHFELVESFGRFDVYVKKSAPKKSAPKAEKAEAKPEPEPKPDPEVEQATAAPGEKRKA